MGFRRIFKELLTNEKQFEMGQQRSKLMAPSHIGYKAAKIYSNEGGIDVIIKLEILGETNEGRSGVVRPKYAKYRCSKARVLDIWDPLTGKLYNTASSLQDSSFKYVVGKIVTPTSKYYSNINKQCASGIHYFLSLEGALGFICIWSGRNKFATAKFTGRVAKGYGYSSGEYTNILVYKDGHKVKKIKIKGN